ncbi:MAG: site-2 protease family protein [Pirellulaceae bacterium]|nr:site-2 protease family protein [Pirellulaceae bacterium]
MSSELPQNSADSSPSSLDSREPLLAELVAQRTATVERQRRGTVQRRVALFLFVATCASTLLAGSHLPEIIADCAQVKLMTGSVPAKHIPSWPRVVEMLLDGLLYSICLMTILGLHEMGHYIQTRRYGVPASLPFFIPMPIGPIGTLGAVIGMRPGVGDRKAIFDIGISGPLAGLVPTLIFCVIGLQQATHGPVHPLAMSFGDPLLLQFLALQKFGPLPEGHDVILNPILFAGWVGLLITSLNLIPIGQLDGGHILYALLRKKARPVASFLLITAGIAAGVAWVVYQYHVWVLMVFLLFMMGPAHPPTANDDAPLGPWRVVLGWLTLAFVFIGFTPMPFRF